MSAACTACRFWDGYGGGTGTCRRRSPAARPDGVGAWPETDHDDWCGEFHAEPGSPPIPQPQPLQERP